MGRVKDKAPSLSYPCHVRGCGARVARGDLLCRPHREDLPKDARDVLDSATRVVLALRPTRLQVVRPAAARKDVQRGNPCQVSREVVEGREQTVQHQDCVAYALCSAYAAQQRWELFSCGACDGPGERPAVVQRQRPEVQPFANGLPCD